LGSSNRISRPIRKKYASIMDTCVRDFGLLIRDGGQRTEGFGDRDSIITESTGVILDLQFDKQLKFEYPMTINVADRDNAHNHRLH